MRYYYYYRVFYVHQRIVEKFECTEDKKNRNRFYSCTSKISDMDNFYFIYAPHPLKTDADTNDLTIVILCLFSKDCIHYTIVIVTTDTDTKCRWIRSKGFECIISMFRCTILVLVGYSHPVYPVIGEYMPFLRG